MFEEVTNDLTVLFGCHCTDINIIGLRVLKSNATNMHYKNVKIYFVDKLWIDKNISSSAKLKIVS